MALDTPCHLLFFLANGRSNIFPPKLYSVALCLLYIVIWYSVSLVAKITPRFDFLVSSLAPDLRNCVLANYGILKVRNHAGVQFLNCTSVHGYVISKLRAQFVNWYAN